MQKRLRKEIHWSKNAPKVFYRSELDELTKRILDHIDRGEVYITINPKPRGTNALEIIEDFIDAEAITPGDVQDLLADVR